MERLLPADVQHLDDPGGPPMEVMSKILQIGGARYQLLFVRSAKAIQCYKYDPALQKWHHLWKKDNVFAETDEVKYCPWIVSEDGYVVVRNSTGIHIFKLNEQLRMELLSSDGRYHDVYNWNRSDHLLLFGHFYADTSKIGIISRNDRGEISFEAVIKEQALARSQQPIWKMDSDPLIGEHWKDSGTGVSLAFVDSSNQHAFTIRTSEKLEIFKFGKNHVVKKVLESNVIPFSTSDDDRVFYGKLFSDVNPVRDVLHFNSTGMTVYKYDKSSRNFVATFYGPQFSRKRGWTADHLGSVMLHDIDRDGIDELFYSGPSGLNIVRVSVNIDSSNALLSDKDMDVTNRHAKGVAVVDVDNRAIVVALGKISVASFTLQLNTKEETNLEQNVIEDSFEPEGATQPISQITDAPPSVLFLHDQLDFKEFLHPRNPLVGTLDFSVPLIKVPSTFGIAITQQIAFEEYKPADVLGAGWSLPIDCIYIERRGSIFPVDHDYYLVKGGAQTELKRNFQMKSNEIISFSLDGSPEVEIEFHKSQKRWIIKTNSEQYFYGSLNNVDWIQWEPGSEDWPLVNSGMAVKAQPSVWFLAMRQDQHGNFLKYIYSPDYAKLSSGESYARRLNLLKITSNNGDSVRFTYNMQYNSTLLTEFFVQTSVYTQKVNLNYELIKSSPRLTSLSQVNIPILKFKYEGARGEMTEIQYPNGLISQFSYSFISFPEALVENKFQSFADIQITYGKNYMLIAGKTEAGQVHIQARDVVGSATTQMSGLLFPALGKESVTKFEVLTADNFFVVFLYHEKHKELCLFRQQSKGWSSDASYMKLAENSKLMAGKSFITIRNGKKLGILQLVNDRWDVKPVLNNLADDAIVQTFSYAFVVHNNFELTIGFQGEDGTWINKPIPVVGNFLQSSLLVFDQFETDQATIDKLKDLFKEGVLQTHHNAVIVRSLSLQDSKLFLNLHFRIFSSNYELINQETVSILIEDLNEYVLELPPMQDNFFKVGYEKVNGKFKLKVKHHTGTVLDEVKRLKEQVEDEIRKLPHASESEKNKYRQESFDKLDSDLQEVYKNVTAGIPFALDPAKFGVFVSHENIVAASHKLEFDGYRWNKVKISENEINVANLKIKLDDDSVLSKAGKNETFKFLRNNKLLWDTKSIHGNDLILSYPDYACVQKPNSTGVIFTFENKKVHHFSSGEFISRMSNHLAIITANENGTATSVKPVKSFLNYRQNVITRQDIIHTENEKQTNEFVYDASKITPYSDGFAFTQSKILPGANPGLYGWYEESFDLIEGKNSTKVIKNSKAKIVKTIKQEENSNGNEKIDDEKFLNDRLKRRVIVDLRPYRLSQEVISYYGFEPYESNRIGSTNNKWKFDENRIMQENLTHFLRLSSNSQISGTFSPKLENLSFVVSSWIRTQQSSIISEILTMNILSSKGIILKQIKGSKQFNIQDWCYVEASYQSSPGENVHKIEVRIKNPSSDFLDVDHVRFNPLSFNFEANLYDARSGNIRAILKNSGMLQQTLLDPFGNIVAKVSESGSIESFTSKSRNSHINDNSNSKVEMKPALGEIVPVGVSRVNETLKYSPNTFSFRFLYKVIGSGSINITLNATTFEVKRNGKQVSVKINDSTSIPIDSEGEIVVLMTKSYIVTWYQGHIISEIKRNLSSNFGSELRVHTTGQVSISQFMLMYDPSVHVFYFNKLGLVIQELVLQDHSSVKIRQIVYDKIDRPVLKTKWTEVIREQNMLLKYDDKFLMNASKLLSTRRAEGLVSDLNSDCEGYPYTWVTYRDDPLEEKVATGLPGKPFSVDGPYSVKFGSNPSVSSIRNLFPTNKGFRHEFELNSWGSLTITVYDKSSNKVAELVKVINHDHRLTTFEYDSNNRLLRVLPPMYHFKAKTLSKADPFFDQKLTLAEIKMRDKWAKTYAYDAEGRLVEQSAPDSGTQRYMYTEEGLLRFIINDSQDVTFYTYNSLGEIAEKGYLKITSEELPRYLANNSTLPKTNNFVVYDRGENELVSSIRHRVQKSRKNVEGLIVTEALHFDEKDQLLNKIFISANNSMAINYEYMNGRLTKINYPFGVNGKPLRVRYDYNVHGKIESVNMGGKTLASIQYTPHEQIKEIHFEPHSRFSYKRKFNYNASGYLSSVRDNFLSETVDYISGSYGGKSFGDGTVSAVSFNSTWHSKSDVEFIKLEPKHLVSKDTSLEQASLCLNALENLGFLDDLRRPLKSFYPATELRMPLICGTGSRANHIAAVLTNEGFPTFYGHRYDYENHKQLIKAKYFQSSDEVTLDPLTQQSFSKLIPGLSVTDSKNVWDSLKSAGFIITDCSNSQTCHALPGKPLFHPTITQHINSASLEVLFAGAIKVRKDLPQSVFSAVCKIWHEHDLVNRDEFCDKVWKELLSQSFVGSRSNKSTKALNPELKAALKNHSRFLNEIVSTLYEHFAKGLGNSAGDIQSYDIDANGNHVHFYTGFKRYRLEYQENTNKISKIFCTDLATEEMREKEFAMEHDSEGSVTKATHKSIANISYDPLNKRVQQIDMIDGRQVFFQYDVRGERILKVVADHNGQILRQKYYIRDIKGMCLVDYEVTHSQNGATHVRSTAYIFSDNVMLGFVRDGQFYSVYSDHEGSIRLVIRNGEVVAAYDYLPYGQLHREYNTDPDAAIAYRYTGQEWDEETNLYNYHARLYDPEIGRFYQIDPKEQYPSPYVYAGNSPISLVDPDGQFAFLIPLAFAAVGGYLGASAANGSFNPTKWKLKPTLIGGVLGAVMGGLAPAGIGASFTFLTGTVGLSSVAAGFVIGTTAGGFAFLSAASANQNWNPLEWNWSDPATFNALFGGAVSGATLFAGIGNVHKRFISLAGTERIIFVASVATSTAGVALYAGAMANDGNLNIFEWNWSSPDTIWKVTIGASFGMQVSTKLHEIESKIHGHLKDLKQLIKSGQSGDMKVFLSDAKSYFKQTHELLIEIQTTLIKNAKLVVRQPFLQLVSSSSKQSDGVIDAVKSILFEVSKYDGTQGIVTELLQNLDDAKPSNRHSIEKRNVDCCQLQVVDNFQLKDHPYASNSGVPLFSSIINDFMSTLNSYYSSFFHVPNTNKYCSKSVGFQAIPDQSKHTFVLQNCYHFKQSDESIVTKCFGMNSQYTVFTKINPDERIVEDSYSFCKPIEFNGNASVVCDGKQSSLVFTPKPSGLGLDYINGCLMLAMVAPAAFSSIKNSILNFSARFSSKTRKTTPPLVENTNELIKRFDCLKGKLKTINSRNVRWINNVVEDLNEDILSFTKNGDVEDYTALLDRLAAVDEELTETIKVEYYRQMFDTSTNTTGPSFENNHTWASFQTFDIRREAIIEQLALECLDIMQ